MMPPCQAKFDFFADPVSPNTISFINQSSGNFNETFWDFGDGTFSNVLSPVHVYNNPGDYQVCLTIYHYNPQTFDTICVDSQCKLVKIPPPNPFNLAGQVFANFFPVNMCAVKLYRIMNNGDIFPAGSTTIDTNGVYYFFQIPAGNYLIQAIPLPNNPVFGNMLPTYFGNTLHWIDAHIVYLDHDIFNASIDLQPYQVFGGGPGIIRGRITDGSKSDDKGPPVPNVEILLFDMQNMPISVDFSNQGGNFKFNDLPFGTYHVYAEIAGKNSVPVPVTIDINNTVFNNVNLIVTQDAVIASLKDNLPDNIKEISDVYPNPVKDEAFLDIDLARSSVVEFKLHNHTGQLVNEKKVMLPTGKNRIHFNTYSLKSGIYVVRIINDDNSVLMKKLIKID
jgi:hypothetical protein